MTQEKNKLSEGVKERAKKAVDPNAGVLWPEWANETYRDPTVNIASASIATTEFDKKEFKECVNPTPSAYIGGAGAIGKGIAGDAVEAISAAKNFAGGFLIGVAVDAAYCADKATTVVPPKIRRGYGR